MTSTFPVTWQNAVVILTAAVVPLVIVGTLFWAQAVFIPVALAIFLTFILNPLVMGLQRRGLGRISSVIGVLTLTFVLAAGSVWIIADQLTSLVNDLPNYTENLKAKANSIREMGTNGSLARLREMYRAVTGEFEKPRPEEEHRIPEVLPEPSEPAGKQVVVVQPESGFSLPSLGPILNPVLEVAGQFALALLLVVFMLLHREDLRDRLIRLMGHGRITSTTKAFDEAGHRISRFLLMQFIVNATYGMVLSIGLFFLDVHHWFLWGFFAAVLRYIPYIGPWIAAIFPIALSLVQSASWMQPVSVIGLFIVLELISNNVMEPYLYRQSVGVSEVALLVTAAFWTFLWGPVGLLLSTPLTVCLVVLGRHAPQLEFLNILLSDEPVLPPSLRYYQRLLARDEDEATDLVLEEAARTSPPQAIDDIVIPALTFTRRDRDRQEISPDDVKFIVEETRELADQLDDAALARDSVRGTDLAATPVRILACAARDAIDEVAVELLRHGLAPDRWTVETVPVAVLTSELVSLIEEFEPAVLCISSLPPGGLAHTRYLCKKIRARFPNLRIMVGRWGLTEDQEHQRASILEAGADNVALTLTETQEQLASWHPVLSDPAAKTEPLAAV